MVVVLELHNSLYEIVPGRVLDINRVCPRDEKRIGGQGVRAQVGIERVEGLVIIHPPQLGQTVFIAFHHRRFEGSECVLGAVVYEEGLHDETGIPAAHVFRYADDTACFEIVPFHIGPLVYYVHHIPHGRDLAGAENVAHLNPDIDFHTEVDLFQHCFLHINLENQSSCLSNTDLIIAALIRICLRVRHNEGVGIQIHKLLHILGRGYGVEAVNPHTELLLVYGLAGLLVQHTPGHLLHLLRPERDREKKKQKCGYEKCLLHNVHRNVLTIEGLTL